MKSPLILVAKQLTTAEIGLLRTLVRLSSELANRWELREDGDCDVLLAGDGSTAAGPTHRHAAKVVVPVLARGAVADGQALARPFRADDFVGLLKRIEASLTSTTAPSTAAAGEAPSGGAASLDGKAQLRRWPSSQLLQGSRGRIQLATMLSRGARSIHELSQVSGRPEAECRGFMLELNQHNLLAWQPCPARAAPTAPAVPTAHERRQPAPPSRASRSLLQSIRQRLGLV